MCRGLAQSNSCRVACVAALSFTRQDKTISAPRKRTSHTTLTCALRKLRFLNQSGARAKRVASPLGASHQPPGTRRAVLNLGIFVTYSPARACVRAPHFKFAGLRDRSVSGKDCHIRVVLKVLVRRLAFRSSVVVEVTPRKVFDGVWNATFFCESFAGRTCCD